MEYFAKIDLRLSFIGPETVQLGKRGAQPAKPCKRTCYDFAICPTNIMKGLMVIGAHISAAFKRKRQITGRLAA